MCHRHLYCPCGAAPWQRSGGWSPPAAVDVSRVCMLYPGSWVANDPSLVLIVKACGGVGAGCEGPEGIINPQEGREPAMPVDGELRNEMQPVQPRTENV